MLSAQMTAGLAFAGHRGGGVVSKTCAPKQPEAVRVRPGATLSCALPGARISYFNHKRDSLPHRGKQL